MPRYRVIAEGINYPDPHRDGEERRAEQGDILDDLAPAVEQALLEMSAIEAVEPDAQTSAADRRDVTDDEEGE